MTLRKLLFLYLAVMPIGLTVGVPVHGQTAPGGITAPNLDVWLRADDSAYTTYIGGIGTEATNGQTVTRWENIGSNNRADDATQTSTTHMPTFTANQLNGNPIIRFDGTDDHMLLDLSGLKHQVGQAGHDYTMYAIGVRRDGNENYILGSEHPITAGETPFFGYRNTTTAGFSRGGSGNAFDVSVDAFNASTITPFLLFTDLVRTAYGSVTAGHHVLELRDGFSKSSTNTNTTGPTGTKQGFVGRSASGVSPNFENFNGDMAEIVIFRRDLTALERQKVQTYLGIKYGISMCGRSQISDTNCHADYVSSSNRTIFDVDGVANPDIIGHPSIATLPGDGENYADHSHDIAGIGRDAQSDLHQTASQSQNTDAMVRVSDPSSLDEDEYLVWGNDNGPVSFTTANTPRGVSSELERVWRFQETGDVGTVDIAFDIDVMHIPEVQVSDFILMLTQSDDINLLDPTQDIERAASFTNNVVTFNDVDIETGDLFTLGIREESNVSLGGVLSNLRLWLDAGDMITIHPNADCTGTISDGDRVRCWQDKSGFSYDVTEVIGDCVVGWGFSGVQSCGVPTYRASEADFGNRSVLEFSRTADNSPSALREALRYDLSANNRTWGDNTVNDGEFTMFIAMQQVDSAGQYFSFFSNGEQNHDGFNFQIDVSGSGSTANFRLFGISAQPPTLSEPLPIFGTVDNELQLYGIRASTNPNTIELYEEGERVDIVTTASILGRRFNQYRINQNRRGSNTNRSKISEIIIYDRAIDDCDIFSVDRYIGQKYEKNLGGALPGNVHCRDVLLWYDADHSIGHSVIHTANSISSWHDTGPHNIHANQSVVSHQPTWDQPTATNNFFNNNNSIRFDGTDDRLSLDASSTSHGDEARTYFIVARPTGGGGAGSLFSYGTNGNGNKISIGSTPTQIAIDVGSHIHGITRSATTQAEILTFELVKGEDSDGWEVWINGEEQSPVTLSGTPVDINTGTGVAFIGKEEFSDDYYNGHIAEVFAVGTHLDDRLRNRVESYMAIKYGITLHPSHDYVDSFGHVLFDSNGNQRAYANNVAGIGRDDTQALIQTDSQSQTGIMSVGLHSGETFNHDDQFLVWGSDTTGVPTETTVNLPDGLRSRLNRSWVFRETGNVHNVDISFDISGISVTGTAASDFTLIQNTDAVFSSGATLTSATSFSDGIVTFSDLSIADETYVTLGTGGGALSVSIRDESGGLVTSPSVSFGSGIVASTSAQVASGTLGSDSEKIVVTNGTTNSAWQLTLSAEMAGSTWSSFTTNADPFDFNDSGTGDGTDTDTVPGRLTVDPSTMAISPSTGCSNTALTRGTSVTFLEGVTDTATLLSAGATADNGCSWDITNISVSQWIPPRQTAGDYHLTMTITAEL